MRTALTSMLGSGRDVLEMRGTRRALLLSGVGSCEVKSEEDFLCRTASCSRAQTKRRRLRGVPACLLCDEAGSTYICFAADITA